MLRLPYDRCIVIKREYETDMADVSTTIFEELKQDIISLAIKPGERISESDICERFGVTRPPVRAAFHRLQDVGLIDVIPYRGSRATQIDLDAICQMIYNRSVIESNIIRDYIRMGPSPLEIEDLEHNLRKQRITVHASDVNSKEFYILDSEMHEFFFRRMHCSYIWNSIQRDIEYVRFRMLDFVGTLKYPDIVRDHEEIIEAIKNKDIDSIPRIISGHLNNGLRRMRHVNGTEYEKYFLPAKDMTYWKEYFDKVADGSITF